MKVEKTHLSLIDQPGKTFLFDTIQHQNEWWLVKDWVDSSDGRWSKPLSMLSLTALPHAEVNHPDFRFILQIPISSTVFAPQDPSAKKGPFRVLHRPDITLPRHLH